MVLLVYFKLYCFNFSYHLSLLYFNLFLLIIINLSEASKAPKLLILSFGGFRHDYLSQNLTPFMFNLSKKGVVGTNMKSTFATFDLPNHYSIATGLYQESHGIIHNYMFDPYFNETFEPTNEEEKWWHDHDTFPIWMINELYKDGFPRHSGLLMWPGTSFKNHKFLCTYSEPFSRKYTMTQKIDRIIKWFKFPVDPANLVMAYFDEPDTIAHIYGPFSPQAIAAIKQIDNAVGYLIKKLSQTKLSDDVNVILLSDHGMAATNRSYVTELNDYLLPDWYQIYGSLAVFGLYPRKGHEDEVYNTLKKVSRKYGRFNVYKKEEIPSEYHYSNNRRIAPILLVAEEGWTITDDKDKHLETYHKGAHGYNNSLSSMRPLFLASGPYFKSDYIYATEFENIDIYPLMCLLLGLHPLQNFPSNGSFERISGVLAPHLFPDHTISWRPFVVSFFPIILIVMFGCGYVLYRTLITKDLFQTYKRN